MKRRALPLCLFACASGGGCDAELYHGLGERQANQAVLALREAGLSANKRVAAAAGGHSYVLTVPGSEETQALRILEERGLPRLPPPRTPRGLLPLPEEQRQQQAQDLGEQLAATLESLPQVLEARVHLTLPAEDPLRPGEAGRPSAAVLLRLRDKGPPAAEVARLVARAVPGLDERDVAIMTAAATAAPHLGQALVRVGPLWVAPGSRRLTSGLLGALGLLAAAVLWLLVRRRGS